MFVRTQRYYVRRGVVHNGRGVLVYKGWDVCDKLKFDRIAIARFETEEQAEGVCKLMNSIEDEKEN
jgi:hypothetical protein